MRSGLCPSGQQRRGCRRVAAEIAPLFLRLFGPGSSISLDVREMESPFSGMSTPRGPHDAVYDSLPKFPDAEVLVKMAADKTEGSPAFGTAAVRRPSQSHILLPSITVLMIGRASGRKQSLK